VLKCLGFVAINTFNKASSMDRTNVGQGRWLTGGPLFAALLVGVVYGQAAAGQAPAGTTPGSAPAAQASSPDKVVLKVGDASVTAGEIEKAIQGLPPQAQRSLAGQGQGRKPIGDEYVMMLVLSQQALAHHLDSTPAFKELLALSRLKILASQEYQQILQEAVVAPEEVSKYYAAHQSDFEEAQVLQVAVRKKPEGAKEGTPGFTPEEAKARVEEIRKTFIAGDDPKQIADKYRVENLVRVDTQPYPVHRGSQPANMAKAAFELKPGEVSEVFDLGQVLAFVKLVSRRTPDIKEFSSRIENTLRQQKISTALEALKKNANVWMDDAYFAAPPGGQPPVRPQTMTGGPLTPQ